MGVVEHVEDGMLRIARVVYGAEPSNEEVYTWVLERWSSLHLSAEAEPVGPRVGRTPGNPKPVSYTHLDVYKRQGGERVMEYAVFRLAVEYLPHTGYGAIVERG